MNIYLTNLGKYNEGELIGEWVTLPISEEELKKVFERIGINERYEEFFITDYECDYYTIGEYDNISELNEIAETVEGLDEYEQDIIKALLNDGYNLQEALDQKDDCILYADCFDMEDVAIQYCEECGVLSSIPEHLQSYFDFAAFGRDMSFEGHFIETDKGMLQVL